MCSTVYAVKRIPRERNVYDSPIIYEIFNEITSLELLAGNKGVSHSVAHAAVYMSTRMVSQASPFSTCYVLYYTMLCNIKLARSHIRN